VIRSGKRKENVLNGQESGPMSERGNGSENTALQQWATQVMRSVTGTVNTLSVVVAATSDIVSDPVGRRRRGTERGGTETKRKGHTSPPEAAAGGVMTVRKETAIADISTRSQSAAKRAKSQARRDPGTRTARSPWSEHNTCVFLHVNA